MTRKNPLPDGQTLLHITADGDEVILRHHASQGCLPPCALHAPSDHPLNKAPLIWRDDRRILERRCSHGINHPDPDGLAYTNRNGEVDPGVHCCDGCCSGNYFGDATPTQEAAPENSEVWELKSSDLHTFVGVFSHFLVEFSPEDGFHIRTIHNHDECEDNALYTYYYARAILEPPHQLPDSADMSGNYFARNKRIPLMTTCDVNVGAVFNNYDQHWEDSWSRPEFGELLTPRGISSLRTILNKLTDRYRSTGS